VDNQPKLATALPDTQAQLAGLDFDTPHPADQTGSAQTEAYRFRDPASGLIRVASPTPASGCAGPGSGVHAASPTPALRTLVFRRRRAAGLDRRSR
jgi:hypothetical protein